MAAVTIRNIPPATHRALKARAKLHARSTEAEIREILVAITQPPTEKGLGNLLVEFGKKHGPLEFVRDSSPARTVKFD
jgi:antitoxin FitA